MNLAISLESLKLIKKKSRKSYCSTNVLNNTSNKLQRNLFCFIFFFFFDAVLLGPNRYRLFLAAIACSTPQSYTTVTRVSHATWIKYRQNSKHLNLDSVKVFNDIFYHWLCGRSQPTQSSFTSENPSHHFPNEFRVPTQCVQKYRPVSKFVNS